jgi:hypothetical protein
MSAAVDSIYRFLDGYPWDDVELAFSKIKEDVKGKRAVHKEEVMKKFLDGGWKAHEGDPPKGFEWQIVSGQLYVRDPKRAKEDSEYQSNAVKAVGRKKKMDTSLSKVDGLLCPECLGGLYKEGVCPACDDGKRGYKIRLLCGECDFTKLL